MTNPPAQTARRLAILLPAALLVAAALAGCASNTTASTTDSYAAKGFAGDGAGKDKTKWPDLSGQTVTILDQGAFDSLYSAAKPLFENITHAKLEHIAATDAGDTLQRALREAGNPSYDVIYGIDNVLMTKAVAGGVFEAYKPVQAGRLQLGVQFLDPSGPWYATPADQGWTAVNVDGTTNITVASLGDLKAHAKQFVTQDPRTSSPGLGFLLATVATYGETGSYTYLDYWTDLLKGGALVTPGWSEAYEQHFSGGYGAPSHGGHGLADRPIVNSYTTSPAFEVYYGATTSNAALTAPKSTFHQVETMGIAKGTKHLAAAQAWIEFTLTDAYQALQAPNNAVYPVVAGIDVASTFNHLDPAPATLVDAGFTSSQIGAKVDGWVKAWTTVYEASQS